MTVVPWDYMELKIPYRLAKSHSSNGHSAMEHSRVRDGASVNKSVPLSMWKMVCVV